MLWGGRWEGGSCLGTHVRIKDFKIKKRKKREKKEKKSHYSVFYKGLTWNCMKYTASSVVAMCNRTKCLFIETGLVKLFISM